MCKGLRKGHTLLTSGPELGLKEKEEAKLLFFRFSFSLGPHLRHREVPKLGVKSELQLPDYTAATATQDPQLAERGQGWDPRPRGYQSGSLMAEPRWKLLRG